MKFLCVTCDEAMKLKRTVGPAGGSLTVVFGCPLCGKETAMLTNAMETQMVRSLGVKIGGRTVPAEPMEMVRTSLSRGRGEAQPAGPDARAAGDGSGSKCPFTGVVADAYAKHQPAEIVWTKEAEERIAGVPSFAQPMVRKGVEMHARERGYTEINEAVMEEAKSRFGR